MPRWDYQDLYRAFLHSNFQRYQNGFPSSKNAIFWLFHQRIALYYVEYSGNDVGSTKLYEDM